MFLEAFVTVKDLNRLLSKEDEKKKKCEKQTRMRTKKTGERK